MDDSSQWKQSERRGTSRGCSVRNSEM